MRGAGPAWVEEANVAFSAGSTVTVSFAVARTPEESLIHSETLNVPGVRNTVHPQALVYGSADTRVVVVGWPGPGPLPWVTKSAGKSAAASRTPSVAFARIVSGVEAWTVTLTSELAPPAGEVAQS